MRKTICLFLLSFAVSANASNMTEADFDRALARIESTYQPYFRAKGQTLEIEKDWIDGTANAFADREGETFIVEVYGGLARHSLITEDAFLLFVCHELGHHIGGAPIPEGYDWPSFEGQSDYFAAAKCLKRVLDPQNPLPASDVDPVLATKCSETFKAPADQRTCERVGMAGQSAAKFFHMIEKKGLPPSFATPDQTVVSKTRASHANSQCRLDTYLAGATCNSDLSLNPDVLDPSKNVCWQGREPVGFRPRCWFKP